MAKTDYTIITLTDNSAVICKDKDSNYYEKDGKEYVDVYDMITKENKTINVYDIIGVKGFYTKK